MLNFGFGSFGRLSGEAAISTISMISMYPVFLFEPGQAIQPTVFFSEVLRFFGISEGLQMLDRCVRLNPLL